MSGKSHFFAEAVIEEHIMNPDTSTVCIREIQKSLKFSAKKLIEDKIRALGLESIFEITINEIRNKNGKGIIIFQGMQDHTADSIKSLEGFDRAWVEEAQSISAHSLKLLLPTIRKENSEIWFSWNPKYEDDPVEKMIDWEGDDAVLVHCTIYDNPFAPKMMLKEAEIHKTKYPDTYANIWLGDYEKLSEQIIFSGCYTVEDFEIDEEAEKLYGLDYGFSVDPVAGVECYLGWEDKKILTNDGVEVDDSGYWLNVSNEVGGVGIEIPDHPRLLDKLIKHKNDLVYADSARPEISSYLNNAGYNIRSTKKWVGSVKDGISWLRGLKGIRIHATNCPNTAMEFARYSYKIDKAGNITSDIIDKDNHYIDAIRYACTPFIRSRKMDVEENEIDIF